MKQFLFYLAVLLMFAAMFLVLGCEKKHKYVILKNPIGDTTIIAESNTTYIADDYFEPVDTPNIILKKELTLSIPIIIYPEKGDRIEHCEIYLADDFKGDAAILVMWPKGWDELHVPIQYNTFYPSKIDSLKLKNWYKIIDP